MQHKTQIWSFTARHCCTTSDAFQLMPRAGSGEHSQSLATEYCTLPQTAGMQHGQCTVWLFRQYRLLRMRCVVPGAASSASAAPPIATMTALPGVDSSSTIVSLLTSHMPCIRQNSRTTGVMKFKDIVPAANTHAAPIARARCETRNSSITSCLLSAAHCEDTVTRSYEKALCCCYACTAFEAVNFTNIGCKQLLFCAEGTHRCSVCLVGTHSCLVAQGITRIVYSCR